MTKKNQKLYDKTYADCQAGGMNETDSHEMAVEHSTVSPVCKSEETDIYAKAREFAHSEVDRVIAERKAKKAKSEDKATAEPTALESVLWLCRTQVVNAALADKAKAEHAAIKNALRCYIAPSQRRTTNKGNMTFDELELKIGKQTKLDWRQAKGGGWLNKSAKVNDETKITENAIVWGMVSGNAQVSGDAWEKSPLFIIGSRWSLTNAKHGHIQIGCHCETFDWWKKNRARLCKEHNLDKAETKEYFAYIDLFFKIGK